MNMFFYAACQFRQAAFYVIMNEVLAEIKTAMQLNGGLAYDYLSLESRG